MDNLAPIILDLAMIIPAISPIVPQNKASGIVTPVIFPLIPQFGQFLISPGLPDMGKPHSGQGADKC